MYIALLEDDADQLALLELWMRNAGHEHSGFSNVAEFIKGMKRERFDLLVIDWLLPDGSGLEVLAWVRESLGWELPVIVLTARDDEATVVQALGAGADDYVVKPTSQAQLIARVGAVSRRIKSSNLANLRLGAYEVDSVKHSIGLCGESIATTQKEFDLAFYMLQSPGKLLSRDHLLNKIWGINAEVDTRTVDTHISRLRKKLKLDGSFGWKLTPVYGYGYRLDRIDSPA